MDAFLDSVRVIFQPMNILLNIAGMFFGILFGAIPGLTATVAISLLIPFTFGLPPVPSLILLLSIYAGGMYGGSITAITIRTPGAPANAVAVLDGYELALKGKAGTAISISCIAGAIGGLFSVGVMIFLSPLLSRVALTFSPVEYFMLAVFGLSAIFAISGTSLLRGMMAGALGLIVASVGMDEILPIPRLTMGLKVLEGGIPFLPAVIGLFALSEVFRLIEKGESRTEITAKITQILPRWKEFTGTLKETCRGSVIGTAIGILPGAGGTIAAFLAYSESKRASKHPETFGTGDLNGVASPEAANNAVTGGAMIPMMTLGIPGDAVTAVLMSALIVQGLQPGPFLFRDHLDVVYPIFSAMVLSNLIMVVMGLALLPLTSYLAYVGKDLLVPMVATFGILGSFAMSGSMYYVAVALCFGVLGYLLERYGFPVAPVCLALILGPIAENSLRQSMIMAEGDVTIFVTRPISLFLLALSVASTAILVNRRKRGVLIAEG
ncbi:MAG: tripartite tricarboxylate transporter permease [Candidatus Rokubacteria bacterium]|nr:tripartite tricarboxylate transporter permease [Candidatus Rokubacteria bacterium]